MKFAVLLLGLTLDGQTLTGQTARSPEILDRYLGAGDERRAAELVDTLAQNPPVSLQEAREIGAVCLRRGRPALATRFLAAAVKRAPEPLLLADLAAAQFLAGELQGASATLDQLARRAPLAPPLRSLQGMVALRAGRRDEALRHFKAAVAADANEGSANFYLGTLATEDGDFARALRHLEVASSKYHDRYAARYNLALAYYRAGRHADGVRLLEGVVADGTGGTAEVENLLAQGYDRLDRVKEAVAAYQRAIRLDPKDSTSVFDLGLMALRRRSYDLAEVVFAAGVRAFPDERNLGLGLGATYQLRGQMDRAQQVFQELEGRYPRDPLISIYLGKSFFEAGRFDQAVEAFSRGIALDPRNSVLYFHAAATLVKLGLEQDPRVREYLEKALALDPKLAPAHYQLAKLQAEHDPAHARQALGRALAFDPELAEAHFLLSRVCRETGDDLCAATALRRYEELRVRERERLENDRVKGIIFSLERR